MKTLEEKLAEQITNGLNTILFDEEEFTKAMSNEHRTLQQNFTRVCLAWIEKLAETDERFSDHRNQASLKISKELIEAYKDKQEGNMKNVKPSQLLPTI